MTGMRTYFSTLFSGPMRVLHAQVWVILGAALLFGFSALVGGVDNLRVEQVAWALILTCALSVAVRYPQFGFPVFVCAFGLTFFFPEMLWSPGTMLCPIAMMIVAFTGHKVFTWVAFGVLAVLGLIDRSSEGFIADGTTVVVWVLFLGIGAAAGWALGRRARQRAELAAQWEAHAEKQREDLTRVLHDSVAATLTAIVMGSERLALTHREDEELAAELGGLASDARHATEQVRSLLTLVNAPGGSTKTDAPSIGQSVREAARRLRTQGFKVNVTDSMGETPIAHAVAEVCHRAIGEAVTNIMKYADPGSLVRITVGNKESGFIVRMSNRVARPESRGRVGRSGVLSSGLGMPMIRRSVTGVGGSMCTEQDGDTWTTTLSFAGGSASRASSTLPGSEGPGIMGADGPKRR